MTQSSVPVPPRADDAPLTDREVIQSCQRGRPEDFAVLVRRYTGMLYGFCYRQLHDRQLAEDATQETFYRAYRGIRGLGKSASHESQVENHKSEEQQGIPEDVGAWLFGVARHCCQETRRRRARPAEVVAALESDAALIAPPHAGATGADDLATHELLTGLSPAERALVLLKHADGLTCQEIAHRTGRPLGTVTSSLGRVYGKLRAAGAGKGDAHD